MDFSGRRGHPDRCHARALGIFRRKSDKNEDEFSPSNVRYDFEMGSSAVIAVVIVTILLVVPMLIYMETDRSMIHGLEQLERLESKLSVEDFQEEVEF